MKCMVMFQYPIWDMHLGIVKDELIYGSSVRFAFEVEAKERSSLI